MNADALQQVPRACDRCVLMLQHTSRREEPYWIGAAAALYEGTERRRVVELGAGTREYAARVVGVLVRQGFVERSRRLDQEWEHVTFVRQP